MAAGIENTSVLFAEGDNSQMSPSFVHSIKNMARREDYRLSEKLELFLSTRPETPFLAMDLDVVSARYKELCRGFPNIAIYYAVKANPAREIVSLLTSMGAGFDVASRPELDLCLSAGAPAHRISFGNTIKKVADIAYAFSKGVRRFAFDSEPELLKLAVHAPGSAVQCRLQTISENADWPLSKKFGCDPDMTCHLLCMAPLLGLHASGVSFHVGSQQTDPSQWRRPLEQSAHMFAKLADRGIELDTVNLGGGLPVPYQSNVPAFSAYAHMIDQAIHGAFGSSRPSLMMEPGRSLVGEAGVIQTEVVLVSRKSLREEKRWVYLDIGRFGGLAETLDESIRYQFRTPRRGVHGPVVIAGPTCDSADVLYERNPYFLPMDLDCGDRIEILNSGAYTSSYSSVGFNGFGPLMTYCL